ncbi:uncharacterized protein LOC119665760 [Teleopsis dalmanni]|uniref:uncharacterized protein LOC119665760 n=1 Tax=Teleopsis dalmanni TaxID=139649 RepID=UPI0018CE6C6C|nr:uncharacterized protein LOC119665760 [Teleopsis dalmanni]
MFYMFEKGHLQKECSAVKCSKCNLSHHQLLHKDYILEPNEQRCKNEPSTSTQETAQSSVMNVMTENEVFLATAVVMVADKFGKYHQMRAILDSGSQVNLMLSDLGGSYNAAKRRLLSLERRLSRDRSTRDAYNAFMDEYLSLGHMTIVEEADMDKIKYFAPHQYVLRPDSTSTKLRVVFDCSCKTDSGLSLNEVMMKGPLVQDDLLSIILRFRCYKYAITADVTKIYRQAWVTDDDANYQTIFWRSSSDENIKAYRLRTITYGTTSAPYLATRCLKQLSEDYIDKYPIGSRKVLSDFYMDDLINGSNDENEIFEIYNQESAIINSAKFKLRKWFSNSEKFLNFVPEADKEKTLRMNDEEIIKTLGIIWAPVGDTFRYVWLDFDSSKAVTKRIVLSELSKLFDPLGLINPLIVKAKIFMQDLWILKANWDESLPMNLHSQWIEFRENLKDVKKISVPRFVLAEKRVARVEMHGFADASKRAFGCCIYIRSICVDNDVTMQLWFAKSRVAPLKTLSLPKLKLLAAELLSKLVTKTKSNFPICIDATYLWVDSEIVLDWLSEHPSNWNTFVANRVSLIQEQTKTCIWRHVPSKSNPADIISRGGPLVGTVEPTVDSEEWSHKDRWLRISAIQQHFWRRWSAEYLHELQQKVKWTKKQKNLNEGDMVLIAEENLPSKQWLIGRVLKVTRDAKGWVRVADVKTKNGEVRQAIHKLAPIPSEC